MAWFKLLEGTSSHQDPGKGGKTGAKVYTPGSFVESEEPLDVLFVNKFKKVKGPKEEEERAPARSARTTKPQAKREEPEVDDDDNEVEEDNADEGDAGSNIGTDVTDKAPKAEEAKVKVFYKDRAFNVYAQDDLNDPLNEEPLKKRTDVTRFIRDLLEAEE